MKRLFFITFCFHLMCNKVRISCVLEEKISDTNILLHIKAIPKLKGNLSCSPKTFKNLLKPVFDKKYTMHRACLNRNITLFIKNALKEINFIDN